MSMILDEADRCIQKLRGTYNLHDTGWGPKTQPVYSMMDESASYLYPKEAYLEEVQFISILS